MDKSVPIWNRLSVRLGAAFLVASVTGVTLVGILSYRSSTSELNTFISHMQGMGGMMGQLVSQEQQAFLARIGGFLWIAGTAGVALALILGWLLSRQIVRPLGNIALAARRVAAGDLEQQVSVQGYGEIEDLGDSFNHMAETLRHDRDIRRSMVADIAHELRTPLSILQGNIEGMIDGVLPNNKETFLSLHAETLALTKLVEDLRTLSLAEAGQMRLDFQSTDLAEMAQRVADEFKTPARARHIDIRVVAPAKIESVRADPDRTAQVLRNLIDNALRYSPDGSSIEIRLTTEKDSTSVSVTDHGDGIAREHLPFVFERFYRVDHSRARATGGSGLGLAIAKQLVEAQGGTIWAESTPGRGSTFSFKLPKTLKT